MKGDADLVDLMAEADELLGRFAPGDVAESWARNLEVVATLATVHRLWQGPEATVGELIAEMLPFMRVVFEMGRVEASGQLSVVSGQ